VSLGFSQLIWEIESELQTEYWPGAIAWSDKNHHNAWSNAITRFDGALSVALESKDWSYAQREGQIYKLTILNLLKMFKEATQKDDKKEFFSALENRYGA